MLRYNRKSSWNVEMMFVPSIAALLELEGGIICLKNVSGDTTNLSFLAAGGGPTFKCKLPLSASHISPIGFRQRTKIYLADSFKNKELTRADFLGPCICIESCFSAIAGYALCAIFSGIHGMNMEDFLTTATDLIDVNSQHFLLFLNHANAAIVTRQLFGPTAGVGGSILLGKIF